MDMEIPFAIEIKAGLASGTCFTLVECSMRVVVASYEEITLRCLLKAAHRPDLRAGERD